MGLISIKMKNSLLLLLVFLMILACKDDERSDDKDQEHKIIEVSEKAEKTAAQIKKELTEKGYKIFFDIDEKAQDTFIMQQYYIAFLKQGPNRSQSEDEANKLQAQHMAHLGKMYELGYADISGPFGDDGAIRGITIYNVPTLKIADSLANSDPMVKAGRLEIELHPWWAAKGFGLR